MNNGGYPMGPQGQTRPGSFPSGMYGHPSMGGGPGQPMGGYGGMRPLGMAQYNGQMGPGYMQGPGSQVS
jgi:hypothetical protein